MTSDAVRLPGAPWVWFDLDDTLWDFTANSLTALTEMYHRRGLRRWWPTLQMWLDAFHAVNAALWQRYNRGEIDTATLRTQRFRLTFLGAGYSDGDILQLSRQLDEEYLYTLSGLPDLVPGAREVLERMRPNYNIGVLSNGFRDTQPRKLQSGGIDGLVDAMVLSDTIGINKPDRRIYDHALRLSQATAADTVMVGDNPETDICGALRAGWAAVWFDTAGRDLSLVDADSTRLARVDSLDRVDAAVAMLLRHPCGPENSRNKA